MATVTSKDGTQIAYETMGAGPQLILVDGAMCYRDSGPMRPLAEALKNRFTVIIYDRRGRGESGNTLPYSPEREVEDLGALIEGPGKGSVYLYGCSSGGGLALEAATRLPGVTKLIVYEIPMIVDQTRDPMTPDYAQVMAGHIAAGRNAEAVKQFMKFVGVPGFFLMIMPVLMGKTWKKLTAIAATLPYDLAITAPYQTGQPLQAGKWQDLRAPTLVADGGKSPEWMRNGQSALARNLHVRKQTLPGQTHMVKPEAQVPMITEFFGAA